MHPPLILLPHDIAAVDRDGLPGDVAGRIAAQEEHGIRDLFGPSQPLHRHKGFQHFVQLRTLPFRNHLVGHRRLDHAWTHVVHTNTARGVFKRGTLREADHAMLRGMIRSALIAPDETTERGAIDNGSAAAPA